MITFSIAQLIVYTVYVAFYSQGFIAVVKGTETENPLTAIAAAIFIISSFAMVIFCAVWLGKNW